MVKLPYEKDFHKRIIPMKAHLIQMNKELLEFCKKKIKSLLDKKLIRFSKSPWSYVAFHVYNQAKKEHEIPGFDINYKPFNKILQWIRHPISNKKDLLRRLHKIFSKFQI